MKNLKKKEELVKEKIQREMEVNRQIRSLIEVRKNIRRCQEGKEPAMSEREEEMEKEQRKGKPRIVENIQLVPPNKLGRERVRIGEEERKEE